MRVTIETDEIHAKKMLLAIDENIELKMSIKTLIVELEKEKEEHTKLVDAIQACTNVFSDGDLYYQNEKTNKEATEIIKGIL